MKEDNVEQGGRSNDGGESWNCKGKSNEPFA